MNMTLGPLYKRTQCPLTDASQLPLLAFTPSREVSAESERESQLLQNHWSEVRYLVRCIYRQTGTPLADDHDQPLDRDKEGMKELVDRYDPTREKAACLPPSFPQSASAFLLSPLPIPSIFPSLLHSFTPSPSYPPSLAASCLIPFFPFALHALSHPYHPLFTSIFKVISYLTRVPQ